MSSHIAHGNGPVGGMPCACSPLHTVYRNRHNLFVHPACSIIIIYYFFVFFFFKYLLTSYFLIREQCFPLLICMHKGFIHIFHFFFSKRQKIYGRAGSFFTPGYEDMPWYFFFLRFIWRDLYIQYVYINIYILYIHARAHTHTHSHTRTSPTEMFCICSFVILGAVKSPMQVELCNFKK